MTVTAEPNNRAYLQEVGPRDGLQNEALVLGPHARAELVDALTDAGLTRVQIGSFVNPKLVPQMAQTDVLWASLNKRQGVRYSVLALNERGLDRAAEAGVPHVEIYASASDTHSRKNSNMSRDRAISAASAMIKTALEKGLTVTAGVMCAFGCRYEGEIPIADVVRIVETFRRVGPVEVGLADTTGMGRPDRTREVILAVEDAVSAAEIALHLHDSEGFGLANLREAVDLGVRRFDSSIGGLGGCPFVPGAKGNISTENACRELETLGLETGVNMEVLREVRAQFEELLGRPLG